MSQSHSNVLEHNLIESSTCGSWLCKTCWNSAGGEGTGGKRIRVVPNATRNK